MATEMAWNQLATDLGCFTPAHTVANTTGLKHRQVFLPHPVFWPDILTPSTSLCTTLLQLSAVYYSTQKIGSILHSPKIQPCYTLSEQFCIPQMLYHQARRVSESETVPYKKLIRQTFGSQNTRNWTCQAKILIDSSTFSVVVMRQTICNSSNPEVRLTLTLIHIPALSFQCRSIIADVSFSDTVTISHHTLPSFLLPSL